MLSFEDTVILYTFYPILKTSSNPPSERVGGRIEYISREPSLEKLMISLSYPIAFKVCWSAYACNNEPQLCDA